MSEEAHIQPPVADVVDRNARRYLELLKGALLDEHYLENELRIEHLLDSVARKRTPDPTKLRDPMRYMREEARALRARRRAGHERGEADRTFGSLAYAHMGRVRLDHLHRCLDHVRREAILGDLLECGTGRGGGAIFMRGYLSAHDLEGRTVWIADPFRATPKDATDDAPELGPDINHIRDALHHFELFDDRVRFLQGDFLETLTDAPVEAIALVRLGDGTAASASDILGRIYDRIAAGGFVVVDNGDAAASVEAFRHERNIAEPIERVDSTAIVWRKTTSAATPGRRFLGLRARRNRPPLAPPIPEGAVDLSVVVVFYNMRREATRTLHSLTRAYQQGVENTDYEVIVVENGSSEDERLGDEFVRSFGPEFRYVDLGRDASPTPVIALNHGIDLARGRAIALMIDGAHVLSPGVLKYGLAGLATYEPAIVATQQWYIGPGDQGDAMITGYDQAYEDGLFAAIEWPSDGYRLFDIGSFIGDRDWFDGLWESNCIFLNRKLLEQVGGFEESFSMPGGGYANLELYERLGSTPDVSVVTIIGEGSFHQLHGGTTTNQVDANERRRRIASYGEHFREIRGRRFRGPGKPIHYVGSMTPGTGVQRTKARRRIGTYWFKPRRANDPEGIPTRSIPIPDELKTAYIDAVWHSRAWQETTWLGRVVPRPPTDLVAYQEIIVRRRPDWILEIGTGGGGRALFLASICDLVDHGTVISIDADPDDGVPPHPRIAYVTGDSLHDETYAQVCEMIGDRRNGVVFLASRTSRFRMDQEFERYAPLVPVGSYVVVEDTILNGHPAWPTFGAGPAEAVKNVINTRGDFAPDPEMERFGLTFNPSGFLKRIS